MRRIAVFFLCALLLLPQLCGAALAENYITNEDGKQHSIPLTYAAERVIRYLSEDAGYLAFPQDIFYAPNGLLYVADTGNDRIVALTCDGQLAGVYTNAGEKGLRDPLGVFVDEDGDLYVADTGNARIVHLSAKDEFIEEFVEPESELYDSVYPFKPAKVAIDHIGQLYILNQEDYHGLMVMDALGEFKGYIATTKLGFNLAEWIVSRFATEEQQAKVARRIPTVNTNFFIDDQNTIYTVSSMTQTAQLKRYSVADINVYPKQDFFGQRQADPVMNYQKKTYESAKFTDVYVDADGVATILDSVSGRLYQYDQEGNLLTIFGGTGNWAGRFLGAISLTGDPQGNLYVLDSTQGSIHVFKPTQFIQDVHNTLRLYYAGAYEETIAPWQAILQLDQNYAIAHIGLGKAYLKQGKWEDSMREYRLAGDEEGYSAAYDEWQRAYLQDHFGWIVLVGAIGIAAAYMGIVSLHRLYRRLNS